MPSFIYPETGDDERDLIYKVYRKVWLSDSEPHNNKCTQKGNYSHMK